MAKTLHPRRGFEGWATQFRLAAPEVRSTTLSTPQRPAVGLQVWESWLPATYSTLPSSNPVVAAATGMVEVTTGGPPVAIGVRSSTEMLLTLPPHWGPQFMMYAVEPLELTAAQTGRSSPGALTVQAAV